MPADRKAREVVAAYAAEELAASTGQKVNA
jgi:hypothetical protein